MVILIIDTWKIDDIKVFNSMNAVEKGHCGTLLCSCTGLNCLYVQTMFCGYNNIMNAVIIHARVVQAHLNLVAKARPFSLLSCGEGEGSSKVT